MGKLKWEINADKRLTVDQLEPGDVFISGDKYFVVLGINDHDIDADRFLKANVISSGLAVMDLKTCALSVFPKVARVKPANAIVQLSDF